MKTKPSLILACGLALVALPGAFAAHTGEHSSDAMFKAMDTNSDGKVSVGSPTVASATVVADVVNHIRGEKKIAYKMKRRKGFRKTIGHRQELTVVKIKEIKTQAEPGIPEAPAATPQSPTTN